MQSTSSFLRSTVMLSILISSHKSLDLTSNACILPVFQLKLTVLPLSQGYTPCCYCWCQHHHLQYYYYYYYYDVSYFVTNLKWSTKGFAIFILCWTLPPPRYDRQERNKSNVCFFYYPTNTTYRSCIFVLFNSTKCVSCPGQPSSERTWIYKEKYMWERPLFTNNRY